MPHLNEMRNFIEAVNSPSDDEDIFFESEGDIYRNDHSELLEHLENGLFELSSYYSPNTNNEYNSGLQDGLTHAINVISRIVESYKR